MSTADIKFTDELLDITPRINLHSKVKSLKNSVDELLASQLSQFVHEENVGVSMKCFMRSTRRHSLEFAYVRIFSTPSRCWLLVEESLPLV
jgi:hypothetical protein